MLDRELEERVAPAQFQFEGDVVAVVFDGADADVERAGDLTAGSTLREQLQDPPLGSSLCIVSRTIATASCCPAMRDR